MTFRTLGRIAALTLALCAGAPRVAIAQDAAPPRPAVSADSVSIQSVASRIEELEDASAPAPEVRGQALELFRSALAQLERAEEMKRTAAAYRQSIDAGPAELEAIRAALEVPLEEREQAALEKVPREEDLARLESALVQAQADESAAKSAQEALKKELETTKARPVRARERVSELKTERAEIESGLEAPPTAEAPALVQEARRTVLLARHEAALAETEMLEQESLSHDIRSQLLQAKLERASRDLAVAAALRETLLDRVTLARRHEAVQAQLETSQAQVEAIGKHPVIETAAEANAALSDELSEATAEQGSYNRQLEEIRALSERIDHEFGVTRQRLEIAGLSRALGRSLFEVRRDLPDLELYETNVEERAPALTELGLAQVRISESRRELGNVGRSVQRITGAEVDASLPEPRRAEIQAELRTLLENRIELLEKVDAAYSENLRTLGEIDFEERQLVAKAEAFAEFLDKHLLWVPTASVFSAEDARDLGPAIRYVLDPERWGELGSALLDEAIRVPARTVVVLSILMTLVVARRRLHRKLVAIGQRVSAQRDDNFSLTLQALVITFAITLIWPLIFFFIGRRLQTADEATDFVHAAGGALVSVALLLLFFFGFQVLCARGGVAMNHFQWPQRHIRLLRSNLRWLLIVVVPLLFTAELLGSQPDQPHVTSLGRLAYVLTMAALAAFLFRVFNARDGIMAESARERRRTWLARFRRLWFPVLVCAPVALVVLALLGYFYSAVKLTRPIYYSLWLFIFAKVFNDLVVRGLMVARRRLEGEQARAATPGETAGEGAAVAAEEVDVAAIDEQSRHLLNATLAIVIAAGLWLIWASVFPALGILEDIVLWQHTATVNGEPSLQPVTLVDLGLAVAVGVVIVIAARNFPGLLEMALLSRLPLDAGLRYAISSVSQYLIVGAGVVIAFYTIGIGWSDVQWLAAALTVGLGFGLQEIFANFVSGLIILFERPVRIGDTVTLGNVTGSVSRIRIRATTITDWDNKEIVIPNKQFITDQLINWTLSNPIIRVVMRVGIAYGSDTETAHRVMLDLARGNPRVLHDPAPSVYFMGLGDSSLNFDVRVYVKDLGDWLPVTHEYHMAVVKSLAEHGIEIPFPQRDIHVRSVHTIGQKAGEETSLEETLGVMDLRRLRPENSS